jgi:hypothetical protein
MSSANDQEEFYSKQRKQNKKVATHFLVDMSISGKDQLYGYYILVDHTDVHGIKRVRPQYLSVWGTFRFHDWDEEEKVKARLQPYNYERDGDYPTWVEKESVDA